MSTKTKSLKVQLVRGLAGKQKRQITIVHGLGLKKRMQQVILPDTPAVRGQIYKVAFLLKVE